MACSEWSIVHRNVNASALDRSIRLDRVRVVIYCRFTVSQLVQADEGHVITFNNYPTTYEKLSVGAKVQASDATATQRIVEKMLILNILADKLELFTSSPADETLTIIRPLCVKRPYL